VPQLPKRNDPCMGGKMLLLPRIKANGYSLVLFFKALKGFLRYRIKIF
jgi:hypothetical protein